MYADDTVINTSAKDHNELQQKLSDYFNRVASWLENDLVMNMKAGKNECMDLELHKKLKAKNLISLIVNKAFQKHQPMSTLVLTQDQTLNLVII